MIFHVFLCRMYSSQAPAVPESRLCFSTFFKKSCKRSIANFTQANVVVASAARWQLQHLQALQVTKISAKYLHSFYLPWNQSQDLSRCLAVEFCNLKNLHHLIHVLVIPLNIVKCLISSFLLNTTINLRSNISFL